MNSAETELLQTGRGSTPPFDQAAKPLPCWPSPIENTIQKTLPVRNFILVQNLLLETLRGAGKGINLIAIPRRAVQCSSLQPLFQACHNL